MGMEYFGPFGVLERIGNVAYKLILQTTTMIHPVFHIYVLKSFKGEVFRPYIPLSLLTTEKGLVLQPIVILQSHVVLRKHKHIAQVLVQWEGLASNETTWENV
jgi:hypothetical protein